jgi:hypothetical protein
MAIESCRDCPWEEVKWTESKEGNRRKGVCSNPNSFYYGTQVAADCAKNCSHSDDLCVRTLVFG